MLIVKRRVRKILLLNDDRGMRSMSAGAVFCSTNQAHHVMKFTSSPPARSDQKSSVAEYSNDRDSNDGRQVEVVLAVQSRISSGLRPDEIGFGQQVAGEPLWGHLYILVCGP